MKTDVSLQNINYTTHTFVPLVRFFITTHSTPYREKCGHKFFFCETSTLLNIGGHFPHNPVADVTFVAHCPEGGNHVGEDEGGNVLHTIEDGAPLFFCIGIGHDDDLSST